MIPSSNPLFGLQQTVGKELLDEIQTCKILVVGSGGIGCELLKDLALSGFRHVEVIDLDTIDVSNLNRQLLFRSPHVGMPKCTVACQVATDMVPPDDSDGDGDDTATTPTATTASSTSLPPVQYLAHHGNVCDNSKFNVPFVKGFALVLNALDNVEARRRVNRLCLAADTPLVEAGTTGYLGQVTVIHKSSAVACYECKTQETQKVYPICTIRSTPSMPVHTLVWAKELYKLIFHSNVEESMLFEDPAGEEPSTYMEAVVTLRKLLLVTTASASAGDGDGDQSQASPDVLRPAVSDLLEQLYVTEIQKQLDMGRYKAAKKTPTVLERTVLQEGLDAAMASTSSQKSATDLWTLPECVAQLQQCLQTAAGATAAATTTTTTTTTTATPGQDATIVLESFDKDDVMAMAFVCAASNLRSAVFGIEPLQSLYSAKGIAGNIIPAIATTNAICAGLQILQCFQILKAQLEWRNTKQQEDELALQGTCCYVNCLRNKTRNGLFLTASKLEPPNPNCFVCRNATIPLALNVHEWTLERFLTTVVKGRLGFEAPAVLIDGDFIWEEGDGADSHDEFQPNLSKVLSKLPCGGIQHGTMVELDDATQNLTIQVNVTHQDEWDREQTTEEYPYAVGGAPPKPQMVAAVAQEEPAKVGAMMATAVADDDDDDAVLIIEDDNDNDDENDTKASTKRPASDREDPPAKKAKMVELEIIELD